jgi:nucleoid-associated protein YgaU
MFNQNSRYYKIETDTLTDAGGRQIAYKRRRFLPRAEDLQTLTEVTVVQADRLDLIAVRTLGDPEQFWRICDASDAMNPPDLLVQPGKSVRVPIPQP